MKRKISILGCGWLGLDLAKQLIGEGLDVKGSTTSVAKIDKLRAEGIESYIIDIQWHDIEGISDFLFAEILIIAITSKSINDFKNFISKIEQSNVKKIIFISSTSVYPDVSKVVYEDSEVKECALADIENLLKSNHNFKTTTLRFAGLFGYNRQPGNFFPDGRVINNPEGFVNFIHRDDCIEIIKNIIAADAWDETFNACMDSHPTRRDFYTKEMLKVGRKAPLFNEDSENEYKIVSNDKLKSTLNFSFKYNDLMNYE